LGCLAGSLLTGFSTYCAVLTGHPFIACYFGALAIICFWRLLESDYVEVDERQIVRRTLLYRQHLLWDEVERVRIGGGEFIDITLLGRGRRVELGKVPGEMLVFVEEQVKARGIADDDHPKYPPRQVHTIKWHPLTLLYWRVWWYVRKRRGRRNE